MLNNIPSNNNLIIKQWHKSISPYSVVSLICTCWPMAHLGQETKKDQKRANISFLFGSNSSFLLSWIAEKKCKVTQQWNLLSTWDIHMQCLHAEESHCWSKRPFGQYLDLGFESPDIHTTGRALQAGRMGADGRQRKAPVLALLGAPEVNHQTAAGVG